MKLVLYLVLASYLPFESAGNQNTNRSIGAMREGYSPGKYY